ncbi:uncharacterized protein LOC122939068 isoform X3 [Bufo gargarizans]|uniref:uncharacterized protein LOC122939068 isoform X3 n=1 Tax=Bufo gargarizans TaxID=30331 RepID=UPI001CF5C3C8|nr:uncharacterized protein LOC122939068 isoform X3 [Bufo gargarizans]
MQNNYKGDPNQAAPNPNGKAKFSCDDCSFSCNSLQNFRIHLQIVHNKSSESLQALGTIHKSVPEKPKWSVVLEAQPVMYVQGKPKGSEEVKAQPAIPKLNQMVQAQPAIPKLNQMVQAQPARPKLNQMVQAQPAIPKLNQMVQAQPAIPKLNQMVQAQPGKPKGSIEVKAQQEKPKWSTVVAAQPEKLKGSVVETQPEKPKEKAVVKPQPEKLKGRLLVRALPEKPKGNVVAKALPEKMKWKAMVKDQPEKPKWKPIVESQPGTVPGNSGRNIAKLKDYIARTDREPLIGLEYVLEYCLKKGNESEIKYFCHLCECDTDVDPMVEHLAGFGHRKLYLAKEYPYVLKAQPSSKEDQSQFIRRMALEIEREEGTKMYMINSSIWTETVMTLRTADKKMRKKTRWDDNKNDETRMKKALKFLETFEIESEIEATTVSRLCEKLTANLKFYNTKTKDDALFPARVARAQDVAMALMRNVAKQRLQNQAQKPKPQVSPQLNTRPPPLQGNANLTHNAGIQSGFPGANFQKFNIKQNMPKATQYPQGQQYPFGLLNQKQGMHMKEPLQKAENTQLGDSFMKNLSQEDAQFFKKLTALLDVLPQNASSSDSSQMNSKLLMLKSLIVDQKSAEHEQANQKLMMQIASMVKDTISAQNASLNQQLMMLMSSQNSTAMAMQTASLRNNLMGPDGMSSAGFVQGLQSSGNMQSNMSSLMPFNQNIGSQMYGQTGRIGVGPVDQSAYQVPQVDMQNFPTSSQNYPSIPQKYPGTSHNHPSTSQNYPSTSQNYPSNSQNYPSTSQNYDNFAYRNSVEGNFSGQGEPYVSKRDGIVSTLTAGQNERTTLTHTDEPSVYDKELDKSYYSNPSKQVPESRYNDRMEKQASYTRVCLSPSSPRNQYADYIENPREEIGIQDQRRHSLRSYNSSNWDDQEEDMRYIKRARLDLDKRSDRSEGYSNQSLESLGMNTASMPEELLKRIKGKDLFTTSAIISEYSERHSGK